METTTKLYIIRRFLQEKQFGNQSTLDDDVLRNFKGLEISLDWLEDHAPNLNYATLATNPDEWQTVSNILSDTFKLEKGLPSEIKSVEIPRLEYVTAFWQRDLQLSQLPDCAFYNRDTTSVALTDELAALVTRSREKIRPIVASFLPNLTIENNEQVKKEIDVLNKTRKHVSDGSVERVITEQKLAILTDLNKINLLQSIDVPQERSQALHYCVLAEAAGGVTEKLSLITLEKVLTQLQKLDAAEIRTPSEYMEKRNEFKLSTQAILKLPKHGSVKEVQREAMALNLSRILGLTTTHSTMVSYQGKPALFVPFEDIHLLKDVSMGKTMRALLFSFSTYTHYSTINPVGEGIQSEQFINDFGRALGLFYLCSDTDAVGGYSQNKAIKGNNLYIFDQVLSEKDKLALDSRLSMQPISFLTKHTRHDQGRNRTLIEDSSFDSAFHSVMELKNNQLLLSQSCKRVAHIHHQRLQALQQLYEDERDPNIRKKLRNEMVLVETLRDDAALLEATIMERIDRIDDIMPRISQKLETRLVKQALIFELLVNKPTLYTDDGRPYRAPWTYRNTNLVLRVSPAKDEPGIVKIEFSEELPHDLLGMLAKRGQFSLRVDPESKGVLIASDDLKKLHENILFPEQRGSLIAGHDYLDPAETEVIQSSYGIGHRGRIIQAINEYRVGMGTVQIADKLACMQATERMLKGYIDGAKDKGFGMHMLKKFYFDVQQKLQDMMPLANKPPQINQAFEAALKLDQVSQFNRVLQEAIQQEKLTDPAFLDFLDECIDKESRATDHFVACSLSEELAREAEMTVLALQTPRQQQELMQLLQADEGEDEEDIIGDVDALAEWVLLHEEARATFESVVDTQAHASIEETASSEVNKPQIDVP